MGDEREVVLSEGRLPTGLCWFESRRSDDGYSTCGWRGWGEVSSECPSEGFACMNMVL